MTKKKELDVVFLLDRSGSMQGSETDTIGGYNSYLEQQRKNKFNTKITTVLFVITTDGLENASREYNKDKIKSLIEQHSNWEFIYIGANIDSYGEGTSIGIPRKNISNYSKSKKGTDTLFRSINYLSECMYMNEEFNESWKKELENTK